MKTLIVAGAVVTWVVAVLFLYAAINQEFFADGL